jgi:glycosyltransferase involved in cell wall biosynthesis
VHVHTPFVAHYGGVRFARRARLPCLATYHTFFEEYLHHYLPLLPHPLARFLARAFTRSQCAQVAALIAPSEPMRAVLAAYGVTTPIHVLPTGLPADRFKSGDGAAFRAREGIAAERPLVTYVGRVAHEKNIGFLLTMFTRVLKSVPQALLVIAGEGPARAALRERAAELGLAASVHFAGYLPRERELLDCYAAADVFVFASRTETQGLVLLEAMAQGAPVVSTAELGTRSILVPGSGALVVPEEAGAFAAAVVRVLQDPGLREGLAARGRAYARSWSSALMAQRLAALYGQLCAPSRTAHVTA